MLNFYSLLIAMRTSPSEDQEKVEELDFSYSCAISNNKVDSENVVSHTVLNSPHLDDRNSIETIIDGLFREMYRIGDFISYESTAKTKTLSEKVRSKVFTYYENNFECRDSIELLIHIISILDLIPNLDQAEEDEKRLYICLKYIYTKAKEIIDVCIDLVDPKHPELSNQVQRRLLTSLRGLTDALH